MSDDTSQDLLSMLSEIPESRREHGRLHRLSDILAIVLVGTLAGADNVVEIVLFAQQNKTWFGSFLELPNGIPSHDTISRVLRLLEPKALVDVMLWLQSSWAAATGESPGAGHIAIDGKTVRRSFVDGERGTALHLLHAWCTSHRVLLEQLPVDGKENEITVIPKLLDLLRLSKQTVTIDAMGCQRAIAEKINSAGGHYILQIKDNQPTLRSEIASFFADELSESTLQDRPHYRLHMAATVDGDHGRVETRQTWTCEQIDWFEDRAKWAGLKTFVAQRRQRELADHTTIEWSYYITDLPADRVETIAANIRAHWSVENQLHWVLDMVFAEDQSRSRRDHAAHNLAAVRRMGLALIKRDNDPKTSLRCRRKKAGWNRDYLLHLMTMPIE